MAEPGEIRLPPVQDALRVEMAPERRSREEGEKNRGRRRRPREEKPPEEKRGRHIDFSC